MSPKTMTFVLLFLSSTPAWAQAESTDSRLNRLDAQLERLEKLVGTQQKRIDTLERENSALRAVKIAAKEESAPQSVATQSAVRPSGTFSGSGTYLPEIGVVADITASSTESKQDQEGNDRLSLREVELVIGHDIDPYSRLDTTISFSDFEDPGVEEAYVSYFGLPLDIKARFGRLRPKVGKASPLHRDGLDTVDEPFVVQRYLGIEGLSRSGLELSSFTPLSYKSLTQQLTIGVLEGGVGEEGLLFGETRRIPSFYGHLSNSLDLSDRANVELGSTYLVGSSDQDSSREVNALGLDLTYTNFITPINKFKFQNEFYLQNRKETTVTNEQGHEFEGDNNPWGFYSLADYRLSERWGVGARYDWVEPINLDPDSEHDADLGITGYLSFYQSEFARWRFQYQNAQLADGSHDSRIFLQGTFAIGTHKHQIN